MHRLKNKERMQALQKVLFESKLKMRLQQRHCFLVAAAFQPPLPCLVWSSSPVPATPGCAAPALVGCLRTDGGEPRPYTAFGV